MTHSKLLTLESLSTFTHKPRTLLMNSLGSILQIAFFSGLFPDFSVLKNDRA